MIFILITNLLKGKFSIVGAKYRTTIPKEMREHLNLKEDDTIAWYKYDDESGEKFLIVRRSS